MDRLPSISSFMSPPEHRPTDNFNSPFKSSPLTASNPSSFNSDQQSLPSITEMCGPMPDLKNQPHKMGHPKSLPSPPVSPWVHNDQSQGNENGTPTAKGAIEVSKDPVLYPPSEAGTDHTADPLFPPEQSQSMQVDRMIQDHIQTSREKNQPTFDEYKTTLGFFSKVADEYNKNPGAYMKMEREYAHQQFQAIRRYRESLNPTPRQLKTLAPAPAYRAGESTSRVTKPARTRVARAPRQHVTRTPKSTPKTAVLNSFGSPSHAPRQRNTEPKTEDVNYDAIENYCPPLDSLGGNTKGLKVEWKGQSLPLDDDPDRHLLLPAEVQMASVLRLSCAQYLTTKRRIFKGLVDHTRAGKGPFKKTHAQQAGHIDVNKASRLWTAYERVGWFDEKYFRQYL